MNPDRPLPLLPDVDLFRRIRSEYQEVPGLSLTLPQARRFWGLDVQTCKAVFETLVDVGFLRRTPAGLYVRGQDA